MQPNCLSSTLVPLSWQFLWFDPPTEPKVEAIDRKAGEAIKEFKDVVFPDDYNPAGKPAAKRKVKPDFNTLNQLNNIVAQMHWIMLLMSPVWCLLAKTKDLRFPLVFFSNASWEVGYFLAPLWWYTLLWVCMACRFLNLLFPGFRWLVQSLTSNWEDPGEYLVMLGLPYQPGNIKARTGIGPCWHSSRGHHLSRHKLRCLKRVSWVYNGFEMM